MSKGTLFVIAAPSGTGKTSLVNDVIRRDPQICVSISHTTRTKRPGEENGVNYFFITETEFSQMVKHGEFLEYATVHNHSYGTSKKFVLEQLMAGKDVILEIDWQGAQQIRQLIKDTVSIFILPPSFEVLANRLRQRKQDSFAVIEQRLHAAREEIKHFTEFDYLIINDDFKTAADELLAVFCTNRLRLARAATTHSALLAELLA
jgi:guanylate kinase